MSPLSRSSHALVTGGGRGIGLAISAALSKAGATVTVLGRNRTTLDEAVASGAAQFAAVADVADQASVQSAIAEAAARQPIDILIANAGAAESSPFGRSDAALFQRMMDVNFMGVVHAAQTVLPSMLERRRGRIVVPEEHLVVQLPVNPLLDDPLHLVEIAHHVSRVEAVGLHGNLGHGVVAVEVPAVPVVVEEPVAVAEVDALRD